MSVEKSSVDLLRFFAMELKCCDNDDDDCENDGGDDDNESYHTMMESKDDVKDLPTAF